MNGECRDVEIDETPLGTMLASLRGYYFVRILFWVFQKVETIS
jgi:hypothetical protein